MGMFDTIYCEMPLEQPDEFAVDETTAFQTKDLDCLMNDYRIDEDGYLQLALYRPSTLVVTAEEAARSPWLVEGEEWGGREKTGEWKDYTDHYGDPYHGYLTFYTSAYYPDPNGNILISEKAHNLIDRGLERVYDESFGRVIKASSISANYRAKFSDGIVESITKIDSRW